MSDPAKPLGVWSSLAGPWCLITTCGIVLATTAVLPADETGEDANAPGVAFFEAKIRPALVKHCYPCHSARSGKAEGGLLLDSRQAIRTGGDRGPAVVPGDVTGSWLFTAMSHTDPDLKMPPKAEQLPAAVLNDFRTWIGQGAPDPRVLATSVPRSTGIDFETARQFWSYQPPQPAALPNVQNGKWAKGELDRFVVAKLEAQGLAPSNDATPSTLIRRLHFDLIGLPPTSEVSEQFCNQVASVGMDAALAQQVDQLLALPQYGERWGRHWLDVARFAESSGKEANLTFPDAWRYRDYVIDCFNADVPLDRFLTEQIAGDLLPDENPAERARLLIATGFLALGPKHLDEANPDQFAADVVDEQIDTVSRAVMANSLACARCHDHKFEPYTMGDYYALAGIFSSTKTYFGTYVTPINRVGGDPLALPRAAGHQIFAKPMDAQKVQQLKQEWNTLQAEQAAGMAAVKKALAEGKDPGDVFTLTQALRIFWRSGAIEGQLETVDELGQPLPLAMGVLDQPQVADAPLLQRGEVDRHGEPVPRSVPQVFQVVTPPTMPRHQSGRLELARWLTDPAHPLTARVMVNRIWHNLFGSGIVRTVDNFGPSGERPSHPQLLDYLALRFVEEGWSVKRLVREIALSRAYRQASTYREDAFHIDPDNRLLWRANKRRLEAEAIRDAMLAVAGTLDHSRRVGSLVAEIGNRPVSLLGLDPKIPADLDDSRHRSVYLPVLRDRLPDVLDLFDFAEPSLVTGHRETTNVPVQALYLMNSSFVRNRAEELAVRAQPQFASDDAGGLQYLFQLCLGRLPTADEAHLALAYYRRGIKHAGDDRTRQQQVLVNYCQALLATAEFRNLD